MGIIPKKENLLYVFIALAGSILLNIYARCDGGLLDTVKQRSYVISQEIDEELGGDGLRCMVQEP